MWKRLKDKEAALIESNRRMAVLNQHVTDMHYWIAKCVEVNFSVGGVIGPLHIAVNQDPQIWAANESEELQYSIGTQTLEPTLVRTHVTIPKLQALGMTRARLAKMITSELLSRISLFLAEEWTAKVMERIYGDDSTGAA